MPVDTKKASESDPFQPAGMILDQKGKDVSARDRSDDGTIIIRRNREIGHNYHFGSLPRMPWHKVECPKCHGRGDIPINRAEEYTRYCDLCDAKGEVKASVSKRYLKDNARS